MLVRKMFIATVLVMLAYGSMVDGSYCHAESHINNAVTIAKAKKADKWEALVWALCEEESGNDDNARNPKSSAYGRFQMLKVYVDECNRIVGRKKYKYADRGNYKKAREMFELYQGHHNPKRDIDRAIIIHRGKKDWKYYWNVKRKIEEICKEV